MKNETELALHVKAIASDILELILNEEKQYDESQMRNSLEYMTRCVRDLVNVYVDTIEDHEEHLKHTVSKAKVSLNILSLPTHSFSRKME
ncbi:hypothetical protein Q73_04535 [Bacillus coahuilensis m2-6]|uniref:Group-specific protein n=2 Tax=Bacillus coahuilensis TaxID=408580 RepID=A0A147KAA0_9BACI|nr:hypothetical protein [Bacillus coahuilensis]KUP07607.1 hypothetical protein Q75_05105 [Bacillus coahuilensis p1.1.43]KUP08916.1 hypothetical protein Q73_04535 [Bacillus coahuilensis m2-6]